MKKKLAFAIALIAMFAVSSTAMAQEEAAAAVAATDWARLAYPLGLGLAALGSGLGLGQAVRGAMEAMGRQPEAAGQIQTAMIIGCAFIEALTIYALISIFLVG